MRASSIVLLLCLGCPSKPSPSTATTATATSAPSVATADVPSVAPVAPSASAAPVVAGPKWLDAAARAPKELADAAKSEYSKGSPFRHDAQIDAVLDRVASQEPSGAGLRAAAKILEDNSGAGGDMSWAGSGTSPAGALLHAAGVALLSDLVIRACAANPKDSSLGPAIESLPLPAVYSSVRDTAQTDRDRDSLRAAAAACGVKSKRLRRTE